jgi:hypothetical protein
MRAELMSEMGAPEGATHYAGTDGDFTWFKPARGGWRLWSEVHKNWLWAGPSRPSWVKEIPAFTSNSPPAPLPTGGRVKWDSGIVVPEGTTHYSVRDDGLPQWLRASVEKGRTRWRRWNFGAHRWFWDDDVPVLAGKIQRAEDLVPFPSQP